MGLVDKRFCLLYNNAISIKMSQEIIMLVDALYGLALSVGSLGFVIAVFEAVGLGLSHEKHEDR